MPIHRVKIVPGENPVTRHIHQRLETRTIESRDQ
jgi:hypothetical protein